jgi:hypothetical protein
MAGGTMVSENLPPHEIARVDVMRAAVLAETKERERRAKEALGKIGSGGGRPSVQYQTSFSRERGERRQEFQAQSKGLRLSVSFSVSAVGIAGSLGRMLG